MLFSIDTDPSTDTEPRSVAPRLGPAPRVAAGAWRPPHLDQDLEDPGDALVPLAQVADDQAAVRRVERGPQEEQVAVVLGHELESEMCRARGAAKDDVEQGGRRVALEREQVADDC